MDQVKLKQRLENIIYWVDQFFWYGMYISLGMALIICCWQNEYLIKVCQWLLDLIGKNLEIVVALVLSAMFLPTAILCLLGLADDSPIVLLVEKKLMAIMSKIKNYFKSK